MASAMLMAGSAGKRRMTGEVRPPRCRMGRNRASGADPGSQGDDFGKVETIAMPFRLPVGPDLGYSCVDQGRMDSSYGKCRLIQGGV
jgi:hypothetical protein